MEKMEKMDANKINKELKELYEALENLYRVAVVDMTIPDLMYRRKEFDSAESALTKYEDQYKGTGY